MNAIIKFERSVTLGLRVAIRRVALASFFVLLAACGGSADAPPPPENAPPQAVPPTITLHPVNLNVAPGQDATFTVAATGTAPLAYQWQRDGVDIAGANAATYTLAAVTRNDTETSFRAVVSNVAGSATSNPATLDVTGSVPVLTIAPQPADTSVVAGTTASFTVGGTCSVGTLGIQWQVIPQFGEAWADLAGATATTYSLTTVIGDNGAQFRALLDCSGQSRTPSNAATLTVTAPTSVTLSLLPIVGLRAQAEIPSLTGIDQDPVGSLTSGSFTFITANRVKRLSADLGTITPVAGGQFTGSVDGVGDAAAFNQPLGLTQDGAGNVYVADSGNHTIRRIAPDGTVSTLAGQAGTSGATDGTGAAARFSQPAGIAIGPDGDLYVTELQNHLIRRVTTAGVVTTYAGSTVGYADGTALTAKFNSPRAVAVAANGDVLVADYSNARVRRIVRNGNVAGPVETLAGNGSAAAGSPDGIGTAATILGPDSLVVRGNTLTVHDATGLLRQIDLTSTAVTTLTGSRSLGEGYADGSQTTARLSSSSGVTAAANGGFMLSDFYGLRLVSAAGAVRTIASNAAAGVTPEGLGTLAQMPFSLAVNNLQAMTVDPAGNVVIADSGTRVVRRISPAGVVTLVAGLTGGFHGVVDGVGSAAQFADLGVSIASDSAGVHYVGDRYGVRRIGSDNATTLLAGSTTDFGAVDGTATTARFNRVFGLAVGGVGTGGNVFAGDFANNAVRRIDAAGTVATYAGVMGQSAFVDGPIATARFVFPSQLAFAPDGSLYVVDSGRIRRIEADSSSVSTLAGISGVSRFAIDAAGTLYYAVADGALMMLPLGGTSTVLIPQGGSVVLGASPRLPNINAIAVLGPKQLVIISGSQILVATLP